MRWIVTKDHHGGCIGLGEDADGVPARGKPEDGDALPVEFRLYTARGRLLFEGRCGDIDADWWHGMEPLLLRLGDVPLPPPDLAPGRDG